MNEKTDSKGLSLATVSILGQAPSTDAQDLYGFVAIENEEIIGSIFFTRLMFESEVNAFLLSPVAIHTNYQGKGIGQKLINFVSVAKKRNSATR